MLSIVVLLHLLKRGGCSAVVLYFLLEVVLSTFYISMMLFVIDANYVCEKFGNIVCQPVDHSRSRSGGDKSRSAYPWSIAVAIPGLILDLAFVWVFRKPTRVSIHKVDVGVDYELESKKKVICEQIGGVGLNSPRESTRAHLTRVSSSDSLQS